MSDPASAQLRGGFLIAAAMAVMNLLTYGYTIVAARLLGPEEFGAFSAVMGVLLMVSVLSLALQATAARRIAADPDRREATARAALAASYRSGLVLAACCALLAPVLDLALRLDSLPTAFLVAMAAVPLTVVGGQAGVLQGTRRWARLAVVYVATGLGRVLVGVGLMVAYDTAFAGVLGVALGAWLPVLYGAVVLRDRPPPGPPPTVRTGLLREVAHSCQALLAFFALTNADMLLARSLLDERTAGYYAAGVIMVKAIVFLPQFVVVVAFPTMSASRSRRTLAQALLLVLLIGVAGVAGTVLLPDWALAFVGGQEYAGLRGHLWLFAVVGTLLSLVQLLTYSLLARQQRHAVLLLWLALVALVLLAQPVGDVAGLVRLVALVHASVFLSLLAVAATASPRR